jgi:hypothetical protein
MQCANSICCPIPTVPSTASGRGPRL